MSNPLTHHTFHHIVSLDKFNQSMKQLFTKISNYDVDYIYRALLPTMINIQVPKTIQGSDGFTLTRFLKGLRQTQQDYFVRFSVDAEWMVKARMEDVFYSRATTEDSHTDVQFNLNVVGMNHVEIKIMIPFKNRQHLLLRELSALFIQPILAPWMDDDQAVIETMVSFHRDNKIGYIVESLKDNFHVLFVPTRDGRDYYPLPIWGLSAKDAKRRYLAAEKSLAKLHDEHRGTINQIVTEEEILMILLLSIQENEETNIRLKTAPTSYGLAELLIGYYINHGETNERELSSHEMFTLDVTYDDDFQSLEIFNIRMKDLSPW